jgi:hypothetical protein
MFFCACCWLLLTPPGFSWLLLALGPPGSRRFLGPPASLLEALPGPPGFLGHLAPDASWASLAPSWCFLAPPSSKRFLAQESLSWLPGSSWLPLASPGFPWLLLGFTCLETCQLHHPSSNPTYQVIGRFPTWEPPSNWETA